MGAYSCYPGDLRLEIIMIIHHLKGDPEEFSAAWAGKKEWDIRRDDRGFEVGDFLYIHETCHTGAEMRRRFDGQPGMPLVYTGRRLEGEILYRLTGYGLMIGWCILTVRWLNRRTRDSIPLGMPESTLNPKADATSFSPRNMVKAIYNTGFPLSLLGQQAIMRTTDIRFCDETKTWGLFLFGPPFKEDHGFSYFRVPEGQEFATYETALATEIAWLNYCRMEGISCYEYPGTQALTDIRKALGL